MSNHRSTFILIGGGLLTLAILGFTAREFQLGPYAAELAAWSPMVAYGTFAGAAIVGALLLVFAPSSRRVENRVQLDRPDATNPVMARPGGQRNKPTTAGMGVKQTAPKRADSAHNSKETPARQPASAPKPAATAAAASAKSAPRPWAHPNDATPGDDGSSAGAPNNGLPAPSAASTAPPLAPEDDANADPETLRVRLADLDRQANHAKVRYGLGQLSANGYRQVLAKLDEERARIEEVLLKDLQV